MGVWGGACLCEAVGYSLIRPWPSGLVLLYVARQSTATQFQNSSAPVLIYRIRAARGLAELGRPRDGARI